MAKFRSREIIEAVQWFKQGDHPKVKPIPEEYKVIPALKGATGFIPDINGYGHFVSPGDWLVEGGNDEFLILSPKAFEAGYEPVD